MILKHTSLIAKTLSIHALALLILGGTRLLSVGESNVPAFADTHSDESKEPSAGDDWPAYKRDAARSGVTSAKVAMPLKVLWKHVSAQPPRPAWSEPGRSLNMLDFDYCFQPVAAGGLVVFGSSADDTVRALKADSGERAWSFTTEGPVRFAPHIANDRCYFASDDGQVYCVELRTGKEVWRFRVALDDRRLLANGRMVSRWPCRSGVLVQDGVVYVTAGMWPSEGVYLHALDAATGRPIWCNDTSCYDYVEYPHAPSVSFGGPAPQGYLLLGKNTLVVPTGRCAPAGFDAKTGKLLHFWANSPNRGGTWATLAHDHIFVSAVAWQPDQSVRLGESVPHRADSVAALNLGTGKEEWPWHKAVMEFTDELKLPRWRSQVGGGIFSRQRVLFQGKRFYTLGNGKADAFEITGDKTVKRLWSVPCPRVYSEALAGNALLIGSQDRLVALHPETGATLNEVAIPGQVRGLAIAGERVFASTERGKVHALGNDKDIPVKDKTTNLELPPLPNPVLIGELAGHGFKGGRGFAVVASDSDARLAEDLANSSDLHVLCLLKDEEVVQRERKRLVNNGWRYGSRLVVLTAEAKRPLPFVSYFANVVVVSGKRVSCSPSELYRVLRPGGGVMVFRDGADSKAFRADAKVPKEEVLATPRGKILRRGKLTGAFDWDSQVEADERVRWPLEFQWFGDPNGQLLVPRHAKPRTPIPANGRLFIFGESHLTALDAYNGAELWRRRLSVPVCTGTQPVSADEDAVYIHDGAAIWQLDAQTGAIAKVFGQVSGPVIHLLQKPIRQTATGKQGETGTVAIAQTKDALEVTLITQSPKPSRDDRWELAFDFRRAGDRLQAPGFDTFELVLDPWRGELIPHQTFPRPTITVQKTVADKDDASVLTLTIANDALEKWLGRKPGDFAMSADVKLWTDDFRLRLWGRPLVAGGRKGWLNESEAIIVPGNLPSKGEAPLISPLAPIPVVARDDAPAVALKPGRLPPMTRHRPDGDYAADFKEGLGKDAVKGKDTLLKRIAGFELPKREHPLTGEEVFRDYSRSYGCSGTSCSAAMDFFRSGTIGMYDRSEDAGMRNISGIRSGCGQTLIPAFGLLLYSESASDCLCSYSFATSLALAPAAARRNEDWALFDDQHLAAGLIRRSALNLGAPGDRRDKDGTLWLAFPRPTLGVTKKTAWQLPYVVQTAPGFGPYRINTDRRPIKNTDRSWIYGSGIKGLTSLRMDLVHHQPSKILLSLPPGKAPKIDGDLNDPCWDGFGALPLRDRQANVFLRHDSETLYIAYEQKTPTDRLGKKLPWKAKASQKDGEFDKDDHVRLSFFNPKGACVVTFAVTAAGGTYDSIIDVGKGGTLKDKRMPIPTEDATWDGAWQAKTQRNGDVFRAEIAIPWKTLTDAGLERTGLSVECQRRTRWGGAKDASLARLLENGVEIQSIEKPGPRRFLVRLHFAELDDVAPGERVFDVVLQGKTVLKDFDIVREAGGAFQAVVQEFRDVEADRQLEIRLAPKGGSINDRNAPTLSGVEVYQQ